MNDLKLKPCPFCGGEAYYSYDSTDCSWYAKCFECDAKVFSFLGFSMTPGMMKKTRTEAIEKWNKRIFEPKTAVWQQVGAKTIRCSRCSFEITFVDKSLYKYCPYCGSKMEYENGIEA